MKNFAPLTILVLICTCFPGCQDDDTIKPSDVSNALVSGTWKVIQFSDDDDDETSNFSGYEFTFVTTSTTGNTGGLIEASNGSSDVVGSWTTENSDKAAKLTLSFGITPFDDLNEDWRVTERTDIQIKLEHVSGGNGGTDLLTFEKI